MNQNINANQPIPFSRPKLGPEEEAAVLQVLRSGWLTTGQWCQRFESDFAAFCGVEHALAVNSATSGLHLALEAVGIREGMRVAVSPYTFTASCEVMRYLGAHPHFVDVAEGSFHLDPVLLERDLERAARGEIPPIAAVMLVHIGGIGLHVDKIIDLARRYHIPVVEDAAHAFPARGPAYGGVLGCSGDVGVFSFYANKTITTGEGGMIVTRRPELAKRMKVMRSHGIDRDVWQRFTTKAEQWRYAVVEPGFKYNLSDVQAAIGVEQLKKADALWRERLEVVFSYVHHLKNEKRIALPPGSETLLRCTSLELASADEIQLEHSWHLFTIRLRSPFGEQDRNTLIGLLSQRGISCSVHYIPLHIMPYWAQTYGLSEADYPRTTAAWQTALSLPLWPGMDGTMVQRVVDALEKSLDHLQAGA